MDFVNPLFHILFEKFVNMFKNINNVIDVVELVMDVVLLRVMQIPRFYIYADKGGVCRYL